MSLLKRTTKFVFVQLINFLIFITIEILKYSFSVFIDLMKYFIKKIIWYLAIFIKFIIFKIIKLIFYPVPVKTQKPKIKCFNQINNTILLLTYTECYLDVMTDDETDDETDESELKKLN